MEDWGFWSVLPALIAIVLAFATRNVIFSLFVGAFSGILILSMGNPLDAIRSMIGDYLFVQLSDGYNAGVIVLLLFIGGFVTLMERSGGGRAFASSVTKFLNTRVKAQIGTWFGGLIIFFSDLGSPLIVGPVFESLYDKLRISREKLAWIIDSTASPVAVMVPFIGWGVYIMGLINQEYDRLGITETDFSAFMNALPYFIYPMLAVLIVPVIIFTKFDFGPMKAAEKRSIETGERFWPHSKPMRVPENPDEIKDSKSKPILIWLPLTVLLVTLFSMLIPLGFPFEPMDGNAFRVALTTAYFFAGMTLLLLMVGLKVKTVGESFNIYTSGMQKMTNVIIILILAWSLGGVLGAMGTADYIVQVVDGTIPLFLVPLIIFIVGAVMSFASGSSWGTFAIMMPLAIPLAFHLDISIYVAIGAVISAGIFGDHCSPISDTTVLSSTGAGCDHIDHNKTQIPIAVFNCVITMAAMIFAAVTDSQWTAVFAVILMVFGTFIMSRFNFKDRHAQ